MKAGGYFYKHDFGRQKRGRKHLKLSTDGLKLTWKSVGAGEVVPDGGGTDRSSPARGSILRSASFSRTTSRARSGRPEPWEAARRARGDAGACAATPLGRRREPLHARRQPSQRPLRRRDTGSCSQPKSRRLRSCCRSAASTCCAAPPPCRHRPAAAAAPPTPCRRRAARHSHALGRVAHHLRSVHGHVCQEDVARPGRPAVGVLLAGAARGAHGGLCRRGRAVDSAVAPRPAATHRLLCAHADARERALDAAQASSAETAPQGLRRVGPHRTGGAPATHRVPTGLHTAAAHRAPLPRSARRARRVATASAVHPAAVGKLSERPPPRHTPHQQQVSCATHALRLTRVRVRVCVARSRTTWCSLRCSTWCARTI
jgi:hypothetical protein